MKRMFAFVCILLSLLSTSTFGAAEPSADEPKSLQEVIQAQTDPSFYEYLQSEIDRSFLPGYQVTGKTILECYNGYDFLAPDKTVEACIQRIESLDKYYLIIDADRCYILEKWNDSKLLYTEYYDWWEQLCTMLSETDADMEICGAIRTVTGITCFKCGDGIVVYIQSTEGIFVRHYGLWYEGWRGDESKPYYSVMDYTWEEFIKYTNDFADWCNAGNDYGLVPCLSSYMWDLAHPRTPIRKPARPISVYVWIAVAGLVVMGGSVVGVILYRRKRRCAS